MTTPRKRRPTAAAIAALMACAALGAGSLAAAPALAEVPAHQPGQLIVKFRDGTSPEARSAIRQAAGVRVTAIISGQSQRVEVAAGTDLREAQSKLRSEPAVEHAHADYVARSAGFVPNDPGFGGTSGWVNLQWNLLDPTGIRAQDAWQNAINAGAPGGKGVIIAVLDTGVAYRTDRKRHFRLAPDLARKRFVRGRDFVRRNPRPYDRNGHGTFIAGTIAQKTNNGFGVTGIAYQARIMPVRVLDFEGKGDVATIARGIRFAARRGAQIINMSFEFDIGLRASQIPDVMSAIRYAHNKGAVLVAAAGNAEDTRVAYPALASNVIAVGATTEHGCLAEYSNTGTGLDIVAPGGGADASVQGDPSCRPYDRPGRYVYQYTFSGSSFVRFGLPPGYEGTSMSVPHVSGTLALMIGARILGSHPSPQALLDRLVHTTRDLGTPGYDRIYGWGLLDAAAATGPVPPAPPPPPPPAPPPA